MVWQGISGMACDPRVSTCDGYKQSFKYQVGAQCVQRLHFPLSVFVFRLTGDL